MVELQNACEEIVEDVEGSLGCAVIDFESGTSLASFCRPDTALTDQGMDLAAAAVSEMFHGRLIQQFRRAWSGTNNAPESIVREVQMAAANCYYFVSVVPAWNGCLMVLVTDKTVSLGLGWMMVHQGLAGIAEMPRPAAKPVGGSRPAPPRPVPTRPTRPAPVTVEPAPAPEPVALAPAPAETPSAPAPVASVAPEQQAQPAPDLPAEQQPQPAPDVPAEQPALAADRPAGRQRTYRGVPLRRRGSNAPPQEPDESGTRGGIFRPRR